MKRQTVALIAALIIGSTGLMVALVIPAQTCTTSASPRANSGSYVGIFGNTITNCTTNAPLRLLIGGLGLGLGAVIMMLSTAGTSPGDRPLLASPGSTPASDQAGQR